MSRASKTSRAKPPRIDRKGFLVAFNRDAQYHLQFAQAIYLDRVTGEVVWIYANDDDAEAEGMAGGLNAEHRSHLESEPERFLEIPGRTHDEHHDILRDFLESDWTDDKHEKELARQAYAWSIGGWLSTVENEHAVKAYFEYKEKALRAMAEQFLKDNGIR